MQNSTLTQLITVSGESWLGDHREALECMGLEETIEKGLKYYGQIKLFDANFSNAVRSEVMPYDLKVARQIESLYKWWLEPCGFVVSEIARFKAMGYDVRGSKSLLDAIEGCPSDFDLSGVQKAVQQFQAGDGIDRRKVMDGLRNQICSAGGR